MEDDELFQMGGPPSGRSEQEREGEKRVGILASQWWFRRETKEKSEKRDLGRRWWEWRSDPVVAADGFEILNLDRDCLFGGRDRDGSDRGGESRSDGASHVGWFRARSGVESGRREMGVGGEKMGRDSSVGKGFTKAQLLRARSGDLSFWRHRGRAERSRREGRSRKMSEEEEEESRPTASSEAAIWEAER